MAEADPSGQPLVESVLLIDNLPDFEPDGHALRSRKVVGFDKRDIRARAFNLLRTSLAKTANLQCARLIGITSATPGAGKSFVTLNLAASLARLNESDIYLVDLDLRRASIAEGLGMQVERGISDYLAGNIASLDEVGVRIAGLPLAVFATRAIDGNSAEYLTRDRFVQMVECFRRVPASSLVLFDLPPAFANDDAMISVQSLDGYVLVVDSGTTTKRHITETMEMLKPSRCIGTVLNRYSGGLIDYYGYKSNAYSDYY